MVIHLHRLFSCKSICSTGALSYHHHQQSIFTSPSSTPHVFRLSHHHHPPLPDYGSVPLLLRGSGSRRNFTSTTATSSVKSKIGFARKLPVFEYDEKDDILKSLKFPSPRAKSAMERYHELRERCLQGGGPRGIDRHVNKNKKVLVRDRINSILDDGSPFLEIGDLAGFDMMYGDVPTAGVVAGIGRVQGVFCFISGNDATVKAGSYYPITVVKSYRCQEIAEMIRTPVIYMPDSGGAFLPMQSEIFPDRKHGGRAFYNQAIMSSKGIHQIALVCGSCTAGGAYNPTMCDDAIIVDRIGKIFLGGPPLVRAATGEIVTDEELGGALLHSGVSGCTDYFARDEEESFTMCRDIVHSLNMDISGSNDKDRIFEEPCPTLPWRELAESKTHFTKPDLYVILSGLLDASNFHEFKSYYGPQAITGTGSIGGRTIGVIANVGDVGYQEALKISHFVNSCDRRGVPLVFFQNGVVGDDDEKREREEVVDVDDIDVHLLKCRGTLASQIAIATVPKIAVTLSGLSECGCLTMCGPSFNPTFHFTWPQALMSTFEMAHSTEEPSPTVFDAFYAAAHMLVDGVIPPGETRAVLTLALQIIEQQRLNPAPDVATGVLRM